MLLFSYISLATNAKLLDRYPYGHEELAVCEDMDQVSFYAYFPLKDLCLFI